MNLDEVRESILSGQFLSAEKFDDYRQGVAGRPSFRTMTETDFIQVWLVSRT